MGVDVTTEIDIERSAPDVAAYAADPRNAPEWYANISSALWQGEAHLEVGAEVAFVAQFMGRRMEYTYEIVEYDPGRCLVMRTSDGPFPMETTYGWAPVDEDVTHMTLRNRGEPSGFAKVGAPAMAAAMRRANNKDLRSLKRVLESRA